MLFFLDESGTNRQELPYEVLTGIGVYEGQAWSLIQELREEQRNHFGCLLEDFQREIKGMEFLRRKNFTKAARLSELDFEIRRDLTKQLLEKNGKDATEREIVAFAQARIAYCYRLLRVCEKHNVKVFASIVKFDKAYKPPEDLLTKDFSFLLERFYYAVEQEPTTAHGIIVLDENDETQLLRLNKRLQKYFTQTIKGKQRAEKILPEPLFVRSHLTTLVQIADVIAYCLNWSWRIPDKPMVEPIRPELEQLARAAAKLQWQSDIANTTGVHRIYGIHYIADLRPRNERESINPDILK